MLQPCLLRALAVALNLDPNWFDPYFDDPILIHRTIYYPSESGVTRKHTDNGIFTVLIQEYFPTHSLWVSTKNTWIDAVCLEDTFVINLRYMLPLWTNILFVSTLHELIHTLSRRIRISIPFFVYPNVKATFEALETDKNINATDIMLKKNNSIWFKK